MDKEEEKDSFFETPEEYTQTIESHPSIWERIQSAFSEDHREVSNHIAPYIPGASIHTHLVDRVGQLFGANPPRFGFNDNIESASDIINNPEPIEDISELVSRTDPYRFPLTFDEEDNFEEPEIENPIEQQTADTPDILDPTDRALISQPIEGIGENFEAGANLGPLDIFQGAIPETSIAESAELVGEGIAATAAAAIPFVGEIVDAAFLATAVYDICTAIQNNGTVITTRKTMSNNIHGGATDDKAEDASTLTIDNTRGFINRKSMRVITKNRLYFDLYQYQDPATGGEHFTYSKITLTPALTGATNAFYLVNARYNEVPDLESNFYFNQQDYEFMLAFHRYKIHKAGWKVNKAQVLHFGETTTTDTVQYYAQQPPNPSICIFDYERCKQVMPEKYVRHLIWDTTTGPDWTQVDNSNSGINQTLLDARRTYRSFPGASPIVYRPPGNNTNGSYELKDRLSSLKEFERRIEFDKIKHLGRDVHPFKGWTYVKRGPNKLMDFGTTAATADVNHPETLTYADALANVPPAKQQIGVNNGINTMRSTAATTAYVDNMNWMPLTSHFPRHNTHRHCYRVRLGEPNGPNLIGNNHHVNYPVFMRIDELPVIANYTPFIRYRMEIETHIDYEVDYMSYDDYNFVYTLNDTQNPDQWCNTLNYDDMTFMDFNKENQITAYIRTGFPAATTAMTWLPEVNKKSDFNIQRKNA